MWRGKPLPAKKISPCLTPEIMKVTRKQPMPENSEQPTPDPKQANLAKRAKSLNRNANLVLIVIVAVLLAGISIFLFAGTLASRETRSELQEKLRGLQPSFERAEVAAADSHKQLTKLQDTLAREIAETEGGGAGLGPRASAIRSLVEEARKDRDLAVQSLRNLTDLRSALEAEADSSSSEGNSLGSDSLPVLISAIATRIGAVVLLLFLVQILVPLYRYNKRLATFYYACADALELLDTEADPAAFATLTYALSAGHIDFGKPPTTPAEQALDVTTRILGAQLKK